MKKNRFPLVSPLLLAGVLLILLPIFTLMTLDRLERQKEFATQRLLEKGMSLIRTFEAGTRTGMFTMRWGAHKIQAMLAETALQPEVAYMMITARDGRILAHSDAARVGQMFDAMPGSAQMNDQDPAMVYHRQRVQTGDEETFEVYKRFVPVRKKFMHRRDRLHAMMRNGAETPVDCPAVGGPETDWIRCYVQDQANQHPEMLEHYIFAGLSMERERIDRARLLRATVWQGVLFFILGCVGMVALFAFQAYRSARASLTSVKAFSDNVIQNMPSGLVTLDADHKITSVNRAAREMIGGDLTRPFAQLIQLIQEMNASQTGINREISLVNDMGLKIRLDITASLIRGSDHAIMGYLFLFRDLTQIKELKKQVDTNRRLAAIGKLAAGVAHEIRNPLSSIKGFATYFGKRYQENATDRETAGIMVKEVERINRSITQLLEFAKPMTVEKKQVDIGQMIRHSLKLVDHDLEQKKIDATIHMDTKKQVIYTDGDRMNQVLLNLYINAIAALDEKGCLEIQVQDAPGTDQIEIHIRDDGEGIDDEVLDLIFDPYFTSRPMGTGLGLSIVHRIVENLGGQIRVESQKGQGTCFTITLPVS